jgi:hypothetical protein
MGFAPRSPVALARAAALALAVLALAPRVSPAQTVTTGAIAGITMDTAGTPLKGVIVTLIHHETGWSRTVVSDAFGDYRSPALPAGRYDVRAEQLGWRPVVVPDVTVSPATAVTLDLRLAPAEPPVTQSDTMAFVEGAVHASLARGTWDPGHELVDLADPQGRIAALATVAGLSGGGLALEGLPDRMASLGVDGITRTAAAHPGASRTDLSALEFPLTGLDHAEIATGADVQWPGYGGELLSAFSARAPRLTQLRGFADGDGNKGYRGALVLGGPVVRDTAWGMLGVDARRLMTKYNAPWETDSVSAMVDSVALDSLGTGFGDYLKDVTEQTDVVTVFGHFDWDVASGQSLALRAAVTNRTSKNIDLGTGRYVGLGNSLDARDVSVTGLLRSRLFGAVRSELSVAVDRSLRDYGAASLPGTMLPGEGLVAGSDGALPGRFERDAVKISAAVLFRVRSHVFKGGFATTSTSHDIAYDPWRAGMYVFGDLTDFAQGRGEFVQSVGGVPDASFSISSLALFGQDSWSPVRGLNLLFGFRINGEHWPVGGVTTNTQWLNLTGVANSQVPKLKTRIDPRVSVTWSAGPQSQWLLRGDAGLFTELVDPSVLAEVRSHDGTARFRRGLGALGAWPDVPDSVVAPLTGPVLTVLNPGFLSPRTGRIDLSIARVVGSGASLRILGQYRHTEYLPRRSDLNLAPAPQYTDQFGRPIYGTLQQLGSLIAATPGTNLRFTGFDRVWAIDPSGYSDYLGLTASFERVRERGISLWLSYTYSHTTDNTPGLLGTVPEAQLSPFPAGLGTADWRDGRSDLDVPHRVALGAEWSTGMLRLAGLLRYQSGLPFTPGFRDGVDANGDGSWSNDPAFVSDTVSGAADVLSQWSCVQQQVGKFAARNSCRGPAMMSVDARAVLHLFTVGGAPADLVVDGINLVATNRGVVDRALYLVDPTQSLTTNAATGVVTVPLVANPNFGKLLAKRVPAVMVRAGLRVNF